MRRSRATVVVECIDSRSRIQELRIPRGMLKLEVSILARFGESAVVDGGTCIRDCPNLTFIRDGIEGMKKHRIFEFSSSDDLLNGRKGRATGTSEFRSPRAQSKPNHQHHHQYHKRQSLSRGTLGLEVRDPLFSGVGKITALAVFLRLVQGGTSGASCTAGRRESRTGDVSWGGGGMRNST